MVNIFSKKQFVVRSIAIFVLFVIIAGGFFAHTVFAQEPCPPEKSLAECIAQSQNELAKEGGYNIEDPAAGDLTTFIQTIILAALSLTGTLFFIYMFYGGYLWFTSGGSEEQIGKAKNAIRNGIIGIAVVLGAFSITAFVLNMFL